MKKWSVVEEMSKIGRRGRPFGFKLSEESKMAISNSKKGQKHKQETKDKISKSLLCYFRNRNPLSVELLNIYRDISDEVYEWLNDSSNEIDNIQDVLTLKTLRNTRRIEISCGTLIECYSHEITPELLLLFKEQCELTGKDPFDLLNSY